MRIQVKDFMKAPVTTCIGEKTVKEVKSLMKEHAIHAVPVIKYIKQFPKVEVSIHGIVTSSDLNGDIDDSADVKEIMTSKVHVIHKDSSAKSAAQMMIKHKVHHLVVMEDGQIIGIISSLDFVHLVAEHTLD